MDTVLENVQLPNSRICHQKAKKTKTSCLSNSNDEESISSDEHLEYSETEYESDSLGLNEDDSRRQRKKKTKKEGSTRQYKEAEGRFKKPGHIYIGQMKII